MPAPRAAAIAENIQQTRAFARVDRRLLFRPHPRLRGSRTSDPGFRQGARDVNSRRVITRVLMLCALFLVPRTSFGRNDFVGLPIHRVDLRVQKAIAIGHRSLAGIVDVFNVFSRANYGSYTLTETSATYGK